MVLGTGGAARALAFGAAERGAAVLVAGRNTDKATALAAQVEAAFDGLVPVRGVALAAVQSGDVATMDVVLNTTPLGMEGERIDDTPVPAAVLKQVCLFSMCKQACFHSVLRQACFHSMPCAPCLPAERVRYFRSACSQRSSERARLLAAPARGV